MAKVDVLVPTFSRPAALAVTLASLVGQRLTDFRVVVSDQTEEFDATQSPEVIAVLRVLAARGHEVEVHKHLPRRGMAEQRQFLLARARAPLHVRAAGGFDFWTDLPRDHCGEDVLAQLRVMARDGGCGLIPSGVYHQELPTTVADRRVNAPVVLMGEPTGSAATHSRREASGR